MKNTMLNTSARTLPLVVALLALAATGCTDDGDEGTTEASTSALTAVCADTDETPAGAWRCGQEQTAECAGPDGTAVDVIYAPPPTADPTHAPSCDGTDYAVSDPGPFEPGDHTIVVTNGDAEVCRAVLHVRDTRVPVAQVHTMELWSPNHKMHHFTPADCVTVHDDCDGELTAHFTFATVDEAPDVNGAGAKGDADIQGLGCDGVDLQAERAGGADGRVYTLGWRAQDHAGHVLEGTCLAVVPHDQGQGGTAVAGPEAVRVEAPANCMP